MSMRMPERSAIFKMVRCARRVRRSMASWAAVISSGTSAAQVDEFGEHRIEVSLPGGRGSVRLVLADALYLHDEQLGRVRRRVDGVVDGRPVVHGQRRP